jgi:hypothetical protein
MQCAKPRHSGIDLDIVVVEADGAWNHPISTIDIWNMLVIGPNNRGSRNASSSTIATQVFRQIISLIALANVKFAGPWSVFFALVRRHRPPFIAAGVLEPKYFSFTY